MRIGRWIAAVSATLGACVLSAGLVLVSGRFFPFQPGPVSEKQNLFAKDLERHASTNNLRAWLDGELQQSEAQTANIRPGLAKEVVWKSAPPDARTDRALVYVHGFSASRGEIAPVADRIAERLHSNLFYTRLHGHGIDDAGESMGRSLAQSWLDDTREAFLIGRAIGKRCFTPIGMSTGALLTLQVLKEWQEKEGFEGKIPICGVVLLSPNYMPAAKGASVLSGPFGVFLARLILGPRKSFQPDNDLHATLWTPSFSSAVVKELMDLVHAAQRIDFKEFRVPVLTIYTHTDTVVSVSEIERRSREFSHPKSALVDLPEARRHELAGEALGPAQIEPLENKIFEWIESLAAE